MADQFSNKSPRGLDRRNFLKAGLALPVLVSGLPVRALQDTWRTFEIAVRVEVMNAAGPVRVWIPLALSKPAPYQRTIAQTWTGNAHSARITTDSRSAATMLSVEWTDGTVGPTVTLTLRVSTGGYHVVLDQPRSERVPDSDRIDRYLQATDLIPIDGLVRETAVTITRGHQTPLSRARAVYDWVVDHTFRDPAVKGCGLGDIRWMLESGSLGGKCADLNALFVGLCRSVGLPARDLYGIRVAPSQHFKSLGRTGDVTTAQHCRAEVFVDGIGWVPADPADVRKVVLEERANASLTDPDLAAARARLFGSWEMNWIAFNDAHDVRLPGSDGKPLPFLMYPQAEVRGVRRDSLDAPGFRYQITAREIV